MDLSIASKVRLLCKHRGSLDAATDYPGSKEGNATLLHAAVGTGSAAVSPAAGTLASAKDGHAEAARTLWRSLLTQGE